MMKNRGERKILADQRTARPSSAPDAPRTAGVLAAACDCLRAWDDGRTLQEIIPRGPAHDLLQNGLFTLFRRRAALDWILGRLIPRPPKPRLRRLLLWAACDYLYLRGVLPQVLADQCVAHVKASGNKSESGFVNAVLRKLMRTPPDAWLALAESAEAPPEVRLGLSPELVAAWTPRLAPEALAELATLLQTPAPVAVRQRGRVDAVDKADKVDTASPSTLSAILRPLPAFDFASGARLFEVADPATFFASDAFKRGDYYVQDPSTLLAPAMLAVQPGEAVADLCCAPGGKALLLAEALWGAAENGLRTPDSGLRMHRSTATPPHCHTGSLTCADRSAARLGRVRENLAEFAGGVTYAVADAARPPFQPASFDAVLLDVPCSNSGVIRRRPDVRWRFTRANVRELVDLQAAILRGAAPLVRPGGRLVYSTCSIEPEENGELVRRFLAEHAEFALAAERQLLPCALHDGACAARLVRRTAAAG